MKEDRSLEIKALVDVIVKGMHEKKAENIKVVDLRDIDAAVCDFFVISNAKIDIECSSPVQTKCVLACSVIRRTPKKR